MLNGWFKVKLYPDSCTCLSPRSLHSTLYMKTLRRVLRVCECVCVRDCVLDEVSLLSEHLITYVLLSFPSTSSHWKLSLDLLPTAPHSIPPLHPPPPPLLPYWRAWKGSTARSQSSGGPLLNCLLSGGFGRVGWDGGLQSREKVAILVSQNPKIREKK